VIVVKRNVTVIETYTGKYVDLLNPKPEQICLADIASGLAKANRFGNQTSRFYSVGEHSVRCSEESGAGYRMAALFHDAHEAYTGDVTAPMKFVLEQQAPGVLKAMQRRLDEAIAGHFGLEISAFKAPAVKAVDDYMLFREAATLKYSHGIGEHWGNSTYYEPLVAYGWAPDEAERRFIECFERLRGCAR
jgi:hypothetical protein